MIFPKSVLNGCASRIFVHPVTWISWLGLPSLLENTLKDYPDLSNLEITPCLGTALHAASFRGNFKTVQILLGAGADPNQQGGYFDTPLKAAAQGGFQEIIALLRGAGANGDLESPFSGSRSSLSLGPRKGRRARAIVGNRDGRNKTFEWLSDDS